MADANQEEVTYGEIWNTLSTVDVSEHIEKKMNLSYLSWAWAWGTMMDHFPEAQYRFAEYMSYGPEGKSIIPGLDVMRYPDDTCSVQCTVTIGKCSRTMWLPVMDNRNNAIKNPNSRAISDTKMRCLVKTIAMFGLGHYIFAGEDLPAPAGIAPDPEDSEIGDPEEKEETEEAGLHIAYETFVDECKDMKSLRDFWRDNREELSRLEKNNPDRYKKVLAVFTKKKKELSED